MKKFTQKPNIGCKNYLFFLKNGLLAFLLTFTIQSYGQTNFYYKGTGDLNVVASWGTNNDGTGTAPGDFITASQIFIIQNTTSITHSSGNFTVTGTGSKIVLGNPTYAIPATPTAAITITISTGSQITSTGNANFEVSIPASGNHKIIYQNTNAISFSTAINDPNLELVFDNTTLTTITSRSFGNVRLINNSIVDMSGASLTVKDLTIDVGCTFVGPIGGSANYVAVKTGGIVTINGTFRAGRTGGVFTKSATPFPTSASTSGTLVCQDTLIQGTNLFIGANSTVDYYRGTTGQASTAQIITALNYGNLILSNPSIANSKTFPATGTINVSSTMSINLVTGSTVATPVPAFTINILPTGRFVINSATAFGTTAGNQRLFLKSDATGTASIGSMFAGSSFFGSINIEKFIPAGFRKYRFLSHPFTAGQPLSELTGEIDVTGNTTGTTSTIIGQTVGTGFTATTLNNPSAYYFNTPTSNGAMPNDAGWLAFVDNTNSTNWARGRGIRVLVRGTKAQANTLNGTDATPNAVTYTMNGTPNVGPVAVAMVIGGIGLNLMGNPYASPVDIGAVLTAATPGTNVANAFYVRNPQTESFITVSPIPSSYIIPAYSAFFVQALTASSLNFAESNKSICVTCPTVFRNNNATGRIEIKAYKGEEEYDNIIFNLSESFSNGYDKTYDAIKLMNNGFNMYTLSTNNIKLAGKSLKASENTTIQLGISLPKSTQTQTYKLKITDFSLTNNKKVTLHDKFTNKYILLQQDTAYDLVVDPANKSSVGENRLELIIGN